MKVKNIDNTLEKLDKTVLNSLCILDNNNVYISIVFILFLYNTCIFNNINNLVSDYYQNNIVKVVMLLLVIYVTRKSYLIGLLLGISYVISINFKSIMENFESPTFPLPNSNETQYSPVSDENKEDSNEQNTLLNETESFTNNEQEPEQNIQLQDDCHGKYSPLGECSANNQIPGMSYNHQGIVTDRNFPLGNGHHDNLHHL